MMEVLSSARSTVLSGYPELNTKCVHQLAENETIDFQFFPLRRLFVEVNKKTGLELLQIKNVEDKGPEISRVKKMLIDNLYCAACPKQGQDHEELALGYSNGIIKLVNYKTSEFTVKFPADNARNSVTFLDFNASNEYLSSVQENGVISLYGMKTKAKLETLSFDNNCTLSRFHPTKRFHMTVASYKGSVLVYDIQSRRRVFQSLDCHAAPCKDVCMSPSQPDILLSVGFDCIINIFDIRKKTPPVQVKARHPLSTIAISDCGYYSCIGNLKGELLSYDLRNTKKELHSAKIHDTAVVRVAFVPAVSHSGESSGSLNFGQGNADATAEQRKSIAISEHTSQTKRDSFCDYLEFHSYKLKVANSNRFSSRRDSFDWELLSRKNSGLSSDLRVSTANRLSSDSLQQSRPRNYVEFDSVEEIEEEHNITDSQTAPDCSGKGSLEKSDMKTIPSQIVGRKLSHAGEQDVGDIKVSENNQVSLEGPQCSMATRPVCEEDCSDKENMLNFSNKDIECFSELPGNRNSTPNHCKRPSETKISSTISNCGVQDVMVELQKMRTEIDSKFKQLESEIRYTAECNKWNMFTQNWNLWRKQMDLSEEIHASVECLLQADPFVNEFLRLQKENEHLKKVLSDLNKSK